MKKDKNNRRKAAIGAVVAAGMTTGAIALAGTPSPGPKPQETELTAADAVVIDGERVEMEDAPDVWRARAPHPFAVWPPS